MTRWRRTATAALATTGLAAAALAVTPTSADSAERTATDVAGPVAWQVRAVDVPGQGRAAHEAPDGTSPEAEAVLAEAAEKQRENALLVADPGALQAEIERQAAESRAAERAASRSAERAALAAEAEAEADAKPAAKPAAEPEAAPAPAAEPEPEPAPEPEPEPAAPVYTDDLDGWIREALDIMAQHGIPGTYEGLHRNIMRESSGDPNAINLWDINAINGTPSIGLLQVIQPTFDAYHVPGTPYDLYDPVANIVAAANYAWDRYGSIDNVNGPY